MIIGCILLAILISAGITCLIIASYIDVSNNMGEEDSSHSALANKDVTITGRKESRIRFRG